jgi:tetratricopeptide (TPR) repeat protein
MSMDRVEILKAFGEELDSQAAEIRADDFQPSARETRRRLSAAYLRLAKDLLKREAWDDSLAACRKAVQADPDNLDAAYFLLTRLEKLNRVDEAWSRLLAIEHRHPAPYAACGKLSFTKACLEYRRGHLETARGMFEEFIEKNHGRPICTAAYGWLGKTMDHLGLHDGAMEAATRYNSLAAATPQAREMFTKSRAALADIETSLRWYRSKTSFGWQDTGAGESDPSPILLVGFPRSGTTLLEQILESHSMLRTLEEKPTLEGIEERFYGSEERLSYLQTLNSHDAHAFRQAYWTNVARFIEGVPDEHIRVVDKFPLNSMHLDIFARLFPGVKVIVALRDPRDCVLSNYFQMYELNPAMANNLSLSGSARQYAEVMELYLLFRTFMPGNLHEVRYEDVVGSFKNECSKLLDFLGLAWEDGLERFHETASHRRIHTPSYDQVTRPLYTDAIGKWKNYSRHLEEVAPLLQPFVETFGYQRHA